MYQDLKTQDARLYAFFVGLAFMLSTSPFRAGIPPMAYFRCSTGIAESNALLNGGKIRKLQLTWLSLAKSAVSMPSVMVRTHIHLSVFGPIVTLSFIDLITRGGTSNRVMHVINVEIKDNHEEALIAGRAILDLAAAVGSSSRIHTMIWILIQAHLLDRDCTRCR